MHHTCIIMPLRWSLMIPSLSIHTLDGPLLWIWAEPSDLLLIHRVGQEWKVVYKMSLQRQWLLSCFHFLLLTLMKPAAMCELLYGEGLRVASGQPPVRNQGPQFNLPWKTKSVEWVSELRKQFYPQPILRDYNPGHSPYCSFRRDP